MQTNIDVPPLVSVIVLTYNSSATVVETLESVKIQTYCNLELIISDDGSVDDTINKCKNWTEENKSRFQNLKILTSSNTGTASNCNRGCKAAKGEWLKLIAGDDTLKQDGIEKLVKFALSDKSYEIVSGLVDIFGVKSKNYDDEIWNYYQKLHRAFDTAQEQYWYLIRKNFLAAMAVLMRKSLWIRVGGFDEEVPLLEDWPMWLKITKAGVMIHFFEEKVANYRLSSGSVRSNYKFLYSIILFRYKYIYQEMDKFEKLKKMRFLENQNIFTRIVFYLIGRDIAKHAPLW